MKISTKAALGFLAIAATTAGADGANAAQLASVDTCQLYGFAPHTREYAACRMNVRHHWTTGPCGDNFFADAHRGYCHLYPPPFL
jgi:hypothetical protein